MDHTFSEPASANNNLFIYLDRLAGSGRTLCSVSLELSKDSAGGLTGHNKEIQKVIVSVSFILAPSSGCGKFGLSFVNSDLVASPLKETSYKI